MERIITLLQSLDRPGTEQVISYLQTSDFARARCYSHHKSRGGLLEHSLEVYDLMMERRGNLDPSSVAVCALFHDLGKSRKVGLVFKGSHPERSVRILESCGFHLLDEERRTILEHHKINWGYLTSPMRRCLSHADMTSTGRWKRANKPSTSRGHYTSIERFARSLGRVLIYRTTSSGINPPAQLR